MRTVAYLRVSTTRQETEKNKAEIRKVADVKGCGMPEWVEEKASSRIVWTERRIGKVIEDLVQGDRILVPEMSRLSTAV